MSSPINGDDWLQCIRTVSENANADIYIISGGLQIPVDDRVIDCIRANQKQLNAMLILTTFGGDAGVAYRVGRSFQRAYKDGRFIVFVSDVCMSAGTLVAIGANELIMMDNARLGPLDVQLSKPDEIGEMISGLTPVHSLTFLQEQAFKSFEHFFLELISRSSSQIMTKTAAEIATKLTTGIFAPIYSHLDPLRLGEYHRNMKVASDYGKRLNKGNLKSKEVLRELTHGYPSHDFIIDKDEAGFLFQKVRSPSEKEQQLVKGLTPTINKDLFNRDERGYYIATVSYLNVEVELTDDQPESEVDNNDKDSSRDTEISTIPEQQPQSERQENNIEDTNQPSQPNDQSGGTENSGENTN